MSSRRRAATLAGLALVLGALAASDVAGREAALRRQIGRSADVVVTRRAIEAGARITAADLAVRRVPVRWAPAGAFAEPAQVEGLQATVALPAGTDLEPAVVGDLQAGGAAPGVAAGAPVRRGERVARITATGPAEAIGPGVRVDVVVTRDAGAASAGRAVLAMEDVEVLAVAPEPGGQDAKMTLDLRVSLRQAVDLAAADAFARDVRVLPRAAGDRRRGAAGLMAGESF
jgi:pilus assembly protein CpaB